MPKKVKVAVKDKKAKPGNSFKDILQQNQIVNELVKSVNARADDVNRLNIIIDSEKDFVKSDLQTLKNTLIEVLSKEQARALEEDSMLAQLKSSRLEASFHKKKFETSIKKMMLINSKFEERPSKSLLSATEIHTHKIMKTKLLDSESKQGLTKKPSGSDISESLWYENYSKSMRILDCMLLGEVIDVYSPAWYCIKSNRRIIEKAFGVINSFIRALDEMDKLETGEFKESPEKIEVEMENNGVMSDETGLSLFSMFEGFNQKIQRAMKSFVLKCSESDWKYLPKLPRARNSKEKSSRNQNYKVGKAINPHSIPKQLQRPKVILFDLKNEYFKNNENLPEVILLIHSCIVIQRFVRFRKLKKFANKSITIQRWFRGYLARKRVFKQKTEKFRKIFASYRIKHWLSLLANKLYERRSTFVVQDYKKFNSQIVIIQKFARSFLARKKVVYWKRVFFRLRAKKLDRSLYLNKRALWKSSFANEGSALLNTKVAVNDLNSFIAVAESKPKKPSKAAVEELIKGHLKNDSEMRFSYFIKARQDRMKVFEDNF